MLRIAHRLLAEDVLLSADLEESHPEERHRFGLALEIVRGQISKSIHVIADNVSEYYGQYAGQDFVWDISKDCPNLAPPDDRVFVMHRPSSSWELPAADEIPRLTEIGWFFHYFNLESGQHPQSLYPFDHRIWNRSDSAATAKWLCVATMFQQFKIRNSVVVAYGGHILALYIDAIGKILEYGAMACGGGPDQHEVMLNMVGAVYPSLLAISFMHCKNVESRDVTDREAPPEKWCRRMQVPRLRYHVLDIDPMKEVLIKEGCVESDGLSKALHKVRGHFVHYSAERPLFGKVAGTFWKPSHKRGKAENGIVLKDYSVDSP